MKFVTILFWLPLFGLSALSTAQAGDDVWTLLGPRGVAGISEFAWSASSPKIVYMASRDGNVYRSANEGETWSTRSNGLVRTYGVYSLAVDPIKPNKVYAGTAIGASGGGLYKSTTGGKNWHHVDADLPHQPLGLKVNALAVNPVTPNTLYAGYTTSFGEPGPGVFKSIDGGRHWQAVNEGLPTGIGINVLVFDPDDSAKVFALLDGQGIYVTTNAGKLWKPLNSGLTDLKIKALAANPTLPTTIFAGTSRDGIFKSTNGGKTWLPSGLQGIAVEALAIESSTPASIYAGTASHGLFKSTDNGTSWEPLTPSGLTEHCFSELRMQGATLFAGGGSFGPFRSKNGGVSWKAVTNGLPGYPVRSFGITPTTLYAGALSGGVFGSLNRGKTWVNNGARNLFITDLVVDPQDSKRVYAGIDEIAQLASGGGPAAGAVYKTNNGGKWWRPINGGITQKTVTKMAVDPGKPDTLYLSTGGYPGTPGVFKSLDGGEHWWTINNGLPESDYFGITGIDINTVTADPSTPETLYAAVNAEGVFKSTDGGLSWKATGLIKDQYGCDTYCNIFAVIVDPTDPDVLYSGAEIGTGAFKSRDGGITWKSVNKGLPLERVTAFAIDPTNHKRVFAATFAGVAMSTDGGQRWQTINSGLPSLLTFSLALDPNDSNTLYAGTEGGLAVITFTNRSSLW